MSKVQTRRSGHMFLLLVFWFGLVAGAGTGPRAAPASSAEPLVAIGDVHGDFDDFIAILQRTGLIDKQHHWAGDKTTLVQVGDLLDRGPKPREVLDLMMSLEPEAEKAGGRIVGLLGNHEMMNIMGDLRYVTAGNYASFADENSEKKRATGYQAYAKWRHDHPQLLAELPQPVFEQTEAEWMVRHPPGFIEHEEAFGPNDTYGKWLRKHAAVAQLDGIVFTHGGIDPEVASMKIDAINAHIHDEINNFDNAKKYLEQEGIILPFFNLQEITAAVEAEITAERKSRVSADEQRLARLIQFLQFPNWLSVRVDGPLWFRGYDQWSDQEGTAQIDKVLAHFKAAHVVAGHTAQKGRIRSRFEGKVFLIDTGMLSSYYPGGQPSALEIRDGAKFTAEYMDQQVVLLGGENQAGKTN